MKVYELFIIVNFVLLFWFSFLKSKESFIEWLSVVYVESGYRATFFFGYRVISLISALAVIFYNVNWDFLTYQAF